MRFCVIYFRAFIRGKKKYVPVPVKLDDVKTVTESEIGNENTTESGTPGNKIFVPVNSRELQFRFKNIFADL